MQIPRWRNFSVLKNSLVIPSLTRKTATAEGAIFTHSFHSTPTSCEKWKKKWNTDEQKAQQPSKNYIRYATRQKRADAKRALKDLLFRGGGSSKNPFQAEDPIWKFDGKSGWDSESDTKSRPKSAGRQFGKTDRKRMKRKFRKGGFSDDFDDPETVFQERFGNRWYTWSFVSREEPSFQSSSSGFEWREHVKGANHRTKDWETTSDSESEDELFSIGSCSDRTILGLPARGPLKLQDVKDAFRLSALKWHPDKHQGPSQAMAEEKFKTCVNAYKSLCDALS